jgi:hypothetical protein
MNEQAGSGNSAHKGSSGSQGGAALLRELAERLRAQVYRGPVDTGPIRRLPGRLPDRLPFKVPLSAGSRVVGSMRRDKPITLRLDIQLAPEQVRGFPQSQLPAAGCREPAPVDAHGGFVPSMFEQLRGAVYCRGPRELSLRVQVFPLPGGHTNLRLIIEGHPRTRSARHQPLGCAGRSSTASSRLCNRRPAPASSQKAAAAPPACVRTPGSLPTATLRP